MTAGAGTAAVGAVIAASRLQAGRIATTEATAKARVTTMIAHDDLSVVPR
jgi:hypothetical protein